MVCYLTCSIAVGFILASIYTMMTNNKTHMALKNSLDEEGQKAYDKIVRERLELYMKGSIFGLVLAIGFFLWARKRLGTVTTVCSFIIIVFVVQTMVYTLMPKSDSVLNYVKTNEQSKLWLENYKLMKNRYHIGFAVGLIGYGVLCYSFTQKGMFEL